MKIKSGINLYGSLMIETHRRLTHTNTALAPTYATRSHGGQDTAIAHNSIEFLKANNTYSIPLRCIDDNGNGDEQHKLMNKVCSSA